MKRQPRFEVSAFLFVFTLLVVSGGCGGGGSGNSQPPPDVSGSFLQDMGSFTSSNCDPLVDAMIGDVLAMPPHTCTFDISQSGSSVTITNCKGTIFRGGVDGSGRISAAETASSTNGICITSVTVNLSVNATSSPTTATFTFPFRFSDGCLVSNSTCTAVLQSRWTRQS